MPLDLMPDAPDQVARGRWAGELNIYAVSDLRSELLTQLQRHPELELDLSGVTEIDTAGVQLLMAAKKEAQALGGHLSLCNHSPQVLALIELYDLAGWLGDPLLV